MVWGLEVEHEHALGFCYSVSLSVCICFNLNFRDDIICKLQIGSSRWDF